MRWVGIDEAGYGPNLGPLVMTAVVAEGPDDRPPDLWGDLPSTIARAKGPAQRLWVDDSKAIHAGIGGLERLEAASLAAVLACGLDLPGSLARLFHAVGAGSIEACGLARWCATGSEGPALPRPETAARLGSLIDGRAFEGPPWRLVAIRSIVCDPARFNAALARSASKAEVHFDLFAELLSWVAAGDGDARIRGDKHGGRHFYYGPLSAAFPDAWIERGEEGPKTSRYAIQSRSGRLELTLTPRADADDGLVALASIVSKTLRELWMSVFNDFWRARIPGLRPTAGYPVDARRFRQAIEPHCQGLGLDPSDWWRIR